MASFSGFYEGGLAGASEDMSGSHTRATSSNVCASRIWYAGGGGGLMLDFTPDCAVTLGILFVSHMFATPGSAMDKSVRTYIWFHL